MNLTQQRDILLNNLNLFEDDMQSKLSYLGLNIYYHYIQHSSLPGVFCNIMCVHSFEALCYTRNDYTYQLSLKFGDPMDSSFKLIRESLKDIKEKESLFFLGMVPYGNFSIINFIYNDLLDKIDKLYLKTKLDNELFIKGETKRRKI